MSRLPDHALYLWLMATAGKDDSDRAIVQCALLHRPFLDDWGQWVCERCTFCRDTTAPAPGQAPLGAAVHIVIHAMSPCETLRLLAWPYRREPGYLPEWAPEEVEPTNPPTLLGGSTD